MKLLAGGFASRRKFVANRPGQEPNIKGLQVRFIEAHFMEMCQQR
jgi:hypothetical protein